MATRCLIVVDDGEDYVVLYKHWDGNPDTIVSLLKEFAQWYTEKVSNSHGYFPHFLYQAEDVAGALIFFNYVKEYELYEKLNKLDYMRPSPDIRPTNISKNDALSNKDCVWEDYVYHLNLNRDLTWIVKIYSKVAKLKYMYDILIDLKENLPEEKIKLLERAKVDVVV